MAEARDLVVENGASQALPKIVDDSGFEIKETDLSFLGLPVDAVCAWDEGALPLGLDISAQAALLDYLAGALRADSVDLNDCDVRLKGSSTAFFSGRHKTLPVSREELVESFRTLRNRLPERFEVDAIERRLAEEWLGGRVPPLRRPFDALYRLKIDREPSDYDIQISCDEIVQRCEAQAGVLGIAPIYETTYHSVYDFVRKDLVDKCMQNLQFFRFLMSDALSRSISVAVFPSDGPPDKSAELGELSSHFRESDWKVDLSG